MTMATFLAFPSAAAINYGGSSATAYLTPVATIQDGQSPAVANCLFINEKSAAPGQASDFGGLLQGVLSWVLQSYLQLADPTTLSGASLNAAMLAALVPLLQSTPLGMDALNTFLQNNLSLDIEARPTATVSGFSGALFPMPAELQLTTTVNGGTPSAIDFNTQFAVDAAYVTHLNQYLSQAQDVPNADTVVSSLAYLQLSTQADAPISLARVMFVDYFSMMMQEAIRIGQSLLQHYPYAPKSQTSPQLSTLASKYKVNVAQMFIANQGDPGALLEKGGIDIPGAAYQTRPGDSFNSIDTAMGGSGAVAGNNLSIKAAFAAGTVIKIDQAVTYQLPTAPCTRAGLAAYFFTTTNAVQTVNQALPRPDAALTPLSTVSISDISFTVSSSLQTIAQICAYFGLTPDALLRFMPSLGTYAPDQAILAGTVIGIPEISYLTPPDDIASAAAYFDIADADFGLITQNDGEISLPYAQFVTGTGDSLNDAIRALLLPGTSLESADIVSAAAALPLSPGVMLALPAFSYAFEATDSLASISQRFNVSLSALAQANLGNSQVVSTTGAWLIPDVTVTVAQLLDKLADTPQYEQSIAGNLTHFLLNGLRLPRSAGESATEGLYALTGQQVTLSSSDVAAQDFSVQLSLALSATLIPAALPKWISWASSGSAPLAFNLVGQETAQLKTAVSSVPVFSAPTTLPNYRLVSRHFALRHAIDWQTGLPPSYVVAAGKKLKAGGPVLWSFGADIKHYLANASEPALTLYTRARRQSAHAGPQQPEPLSVYAWATLVDLRIRKVPGSQPAIYAVMVDDQARAQLSQISALSGLSLSIAYLTDAGGAGLTSDIGGTADQDSIVFVPNADAAAPVALSAVPSVLQLLVQRGIDAAPLYLSYQTARCPNGLPDALFKQSSAAVIKLLVAYPTASVPASANAVITEAPFALGQTVFYASTAAVVPKTVVAPGNVGFMLSEQITAADAGGVTGLFRMLSYRASHRPAALSCSPAVMQNADGSQVWNYSKLIPLVLSQANPAPAPGAFVALPPAAGNPYQGVVVQQTPLSVDFELRDIFGNHLTPAAWQSGLSFQLVYYDRLIPIQAWPNVGSDYTIVNKALQLTLDFALSKYWVQPGQTAFSELSQALQFDLVRYAQIYYQVNQPDVELGCTFSIASVSLQSDAVTSLGAWAGDIYSYLATIQYLIQQKLWTLQTGDGLTAPAVSIDFDTSGLPSGLSIHALTAIGSLASVAQAIGGNAVDLFFANAQIANLLTTNANFSLAPTLALDQGAPAALTIALPISTSTTLEFLFTQFSNGLSVAVGKTLAAQTGATSAAVAIGGLTLNFPVDATSTAAMIQTQLAQQLTAAEFASLIASDQILAVEAVLLQPPSELSFSNTLTAKTLNAITPLNLSLTLARNPALIDPSLPDAAAAAATQASTQVSPRFSDRHTSKALTLESFAADFQAQFPLWHVGSAHQRGSRQGHLHIVPFHGLYNYQVAPGSAQYYLPKPLATQRVSADAVTIRAYDANSGYTATQSRNFKNVDLNQWALSFLETVDQLMRPAYLVPLAKYRPAHYETLLKQRQTLASAIGNGVGPIFGDDTPSKIALVNAQSAIANDTASSLASALQGNIVVQSKMEWAGQVIGVTSFKRALEILFSKSELATAVQLEHAQREIINTNLFLPLLTGTQPYLLPWNPKAANYNSNKPNYSIGPQASLQSALVGAGYWNASDNAPDFNALLDPSLDFFDLPILDFIQPPVRLSVVKTGGAALSLASYATSAAPSNNLAKLVAADQLIPGALPRYSAECLADVLGNIPGFVISAPTITIDGTTCSDSTCPNSLQQAYGAIASCFSDKQIPFSWPDFITQILPQNCLSFQNTTVNFDWTTATTTPVNLQQAFVELFKNTASKTAEQIAQLQQQLITDNLYLPLIGGAPIPCQNVYWIEPQESLESMLVAAEYWDTDTNVPDFDVLLSATLDFFDLPILDGNNAPGILNNPATGGTPLSLSGHASLNALSAVEFSFGLQQYTTACLAIVLKDVENMVAKAPSFSFNGQSPTLSTGISLGALYDQVATFYTSNGGSIGWDAFVLQISGQPILNTALTVNLAWTSAPGCSTLNQALAILFPQATSGTALVAAQKTLVNANMFLSLLGNRYFPSNQSPTVYHVTAGETLHSVLKNCKYWNGPTHRPCFSVLLTPELNFFELPILDPSHPPGTLSVVSQGGTAVNLTQYATVQSPSNGLTTLANAKNLLPGLSQYSVNGWADLLRDVPDFFLTAPSLTINEKTVMLPVSASTTLTMLYQQAKNFNTSGATISWPDFIYQISGQDVFNFSIPLLVQRTVAKPALPPFLPPRVHGKPVSNTQTPIPAAPDNTFSQLLKSYATADNGISLSYLAYVIADVPLFIDGSSATGMPAPFAPGDTLASIATALGATPAHAIRLLKDAQVLTPGKIVDLTWIICTIPSGATRPITLLSIAKSWNITITDLLFANLNNTGLFVTGAAIDISETQNYSIQQGDCLIDVLAQYPGYVATHEFKQQAQIVGTPEHQLVDNLTLINNPGLLNPKSQIGSLYLAPGHAWSSGHYDCVISSDNEPIASHVSLLFKPATQTDRQAFADLSLQQNTLEFERSDVATPFSGVLGNNLSLILPRRQQLDNYVIPVPLCSSPRNPTMLEQSAVAKPFSNQAIALKEAKQWIYAFTYLAGDQAQDTVEITLDVAAGTPPGATVPPSGVGSSDLFQKLAQFVSIRSALVDGFNLLPKLESVASSAALDNALGCFATLLKDITSDWSAWQTQTVTPAPTPSDVISQRYGLTETRTASHCEITVYPLTPGIDPYDLPLVVADPDFWTPSESKPIIIAGAVPVAIYRFTLKSGVVLPAQQKRTLQFNSPFDIIQSQSATATTQIFRNKDLVAGKTTHPDFVFASAPVSFTQPAVPCIERHQVVSFFSLHPFRSRPTRILTDLFEQLGEGQIAEVQFTCQYLPKAGNRAFVSQAPILMCRRIGLQNKNFIKFIGIAFKDWLNANPNANGTLEFDLALYVPSSSKPVLHLHRLQVPLVPQGIQLQRVQAELSPEENPSGQPSIINNLDAVNPLVANISMGANVLPNTVTRANLLYGDPVRIKSWTGGMVWGDSQTKYYYNGNWAVSRQVPIYADPVIACYVSPGQSSYLNYFAPAANKENDLAVYAGVDGKLAWAAGFHLSMPNPFVQGSAAYNSGSSAANVYNNDGLIFNGGAPSTGADWVAANVTPTLTDGFPIDAPNTPLPANSYQAGLCQYGAWRDTLCVTPCTSGFDPIAVAAMAAKLHAQGDFHAVFDMINEDGAAKNAARANHLLRMTITQGSPFTQFLSVGQQGARIAAVFNPVPPEGNSYQPIPAQLIDLGEMPKSNASLHAALIVQQVNFFNGEDVGVGGNTETRCNWAIFAVYWNPLEVSDFKVDATHNAVYLVFNDPYPGNHFVVAGLPSQLANVYDTASTPFDLALATKWAERLAPYAFNYVTESTVDYAVGQSKGQAQQVQPNAVTTTYACTLDAVGPIGAQAAGNTVLLLQPHHYQTFADGQNQSVLNQPVVPLLTPAQQEKDGGYWISRGRLEAIVGNGFSITYLYPNMLPFLPEVDPVSTKNSKAVKANPQNFPPSQGPSQFNVVEMMAAMIGYHWVAEFPSADNVPQDGPATTSMSNPECMHGTYNGGKAFYRAAKMLPMLLQMVQSDYFNSQDVMERINGTSKYLSNQAGQSVYCVGGTSGGEYFSPGLALHDFIANLIEAFGYYLGEPGSHVSRSISAVDGSLTGKSCYYSYFDQANHHLFFYPAGGAGGQWPTNVDFSAIIPQDQVLIFEGYGTVAMLNDHAYTYGYFIAAAATLAMILKNDLSSLQYTPVTGPLQMGAPQAVCPDPAEWASWQNWLATWQPTIDQMVMDIAFDPEITDLGLLPGMSYPKMEYMDQWTGMSWTDGFPESSTVYGHNANSPWEQMQAWGSIVLWGQATGRQSVADLGTYLFTTGLYALDAYRYNTTGTYIPSADDPDHSQDGTYVVRATTDFMGPYQPSITGGPTGYNPVTFGVQPFSGKSMWDTMMSADLTNGATSHVTYIYQGGVRSDDTYWNSPVAYLSSAIFPHNSFTFCLSRDSSYMTQWCEAVQYQNGRTNYQLPYGSSCNFLFAQLGINASLAGVDYSGDYFTSSNLSLNITAVDGAVIPASVATQFESTLSTAGLSYVSSSVSTTNIQFVFEDSVSQYQALNVLAPSLKPYQIAPTIVPVPFELNDIGYAPIQQAHRENPSRNAFNYLEWNAQQTPYDWFWSLCTDNPMTSDITKNTAPWLNIASGTTLAMMLSSDKSEAEALNYFYLYDAYGTPDFSVYAQATTGTGTGTGTGILQPSAMAFVKAAKTTIYMAYNPNDQDIVVQFYDLKTQQPVAKPETIKPYELKKW